jgi:outer membrane protein assembly factor BamB
VPRTRRSLVAGLAGLAVLLTSFVPTNAGAGPDPEAEHRALCAEPGGGDWASYGNTPDNRRWQVDAFGPSKEDLRSMDVAWKFRPADAGLVGGFSNTPIVLEGCVYIATTMGDVAALNAETGELVWAADTLVGNAVLTSANVITGSPTVVGDTIFVGVSWNSQSGNPGARPYLAALDRWTGELLWTSTIEEHQPEAFTVPAPVHHRGNILIGFSVYFDPNEERGGYAIIDASRECGGSTALVTCTNPTPGATGGTRKVHRYTIPQEDFEAGYGGAGLWCTAAVNEATSYAYGCTSNPSSPREHELTNSLLKIDLDPARATFGDIVASYKGDPDNYVEGAEDQPACQNDQLAHATDPYYSAACLQLDLDFGASPHLFTDADGEQIVASLQKSGTYHAVRTADMSGAWKKPVGVPCLFWCNGSSPAHDGERSYVVGSPGGMMYALDTQGDLGWAHPIGNAFHYHPVSGANGIVYTLNTLDVVTAVDTATGLTVVEHPVTADVGTPPSVELKAGGIAIARKALYVQTAEWLVVYR